MLINKLDKDMSHRLSIHRDRRISIFHDPRLLVLFVQKVCSHDLWIKISQ